jgi:histidyl-tRNA synthetase
MTMIRLKDTKHASTADFLQNAIGIAEYYGFRPLDEMKTTRPDAARRKLIAKNEEGITYARKEERTLASAARRCASCVGAKDGFLAWRTVQGAGGIPAVSLELHAIGSPSAIAEALLLIVGNAIAEEAGLSKRTLSINNIGSFESSNRFVRDIGSYLRKHLETISPTLRPKTAEDPLGALIQLIERGHPATPRAPQATEYLTEDERRKFWELLEYLETLSMAYELSPHVLGSRDCWAHSLYELSTVDEETGSRLSFAFGGRYDPLASRFALSPMHAATLSINCEVRGKTKTRREARSMPAIYFAHLGPEAKRRSLVILESLRQAEIPVHQSLLHERIGEQMAQAKQMAAPYILIVGYKEAMENTVLIREVATNSQEAVPVDELTGYLKRRRVGMMKDLVV